jgi:uncharacterized protein (TIGR02246 family)
MRATAEGDLETVFGLIAEDAVFLLPDQPPMRGREAFAAAFRSALGQVRIEGKPDIQEIYVAGDYAFCWDQLSLTVTPLQGGPAHRRAGPTLSVFRKSRTDAGFSFAMQTCSKRHECSGSSTEPPDTNDKCGNYFKDRCIPGARRG